MHLILDCTITELVQEHVSQPSFTESLFCEQEFLRGEISSDQIHSVIEDAIVNDAPLTKVRPSERPYLHSTIISLFLFFRLFG